MLRNKWERGLCLINCFQVENDFHLQLAEEATKDMTSQREMKLKKRKNQ